MQQRPQPYSEYFLKVGAKVPFGLDWESWLENRWFAGRLYSLNYVLRPTHATGYEYKCTTAGYSADAEPAWPTTGTIADGTAIWTPQAVSAASLSATISSAPWSAPAGITVTNQVLSGYKSTALVDTSAASAGVDYDVLNTLNLSDGTSLPGVWRIKVR